MASSVKDLKGFNSVFESTLNNDILDGLVEFFDWGLLEKGNYFNVDLEEQSPRGKDYSKFRMVTNNHFSSGQLWAASRSNWVWQSGIAGVGGNTAPIVGSDHTNPGISGVYVDGDFHPVTSTGTYSHNIDYFNGRVLFDTALPTGSLVQAEFSHKWINVVYAASLPWLREIQRDTAEPSDNFSEQDRGDYNAPAEARLQLPAIAIEVVPVRKFKGYQLGGGQWVYTDVLFHCIAEDEVTRNKLVDIVSLQNDKTIELFNSNTINSSGAFPLNVANTPVSGALRYPDLITTYPGGALRLTNMTVQKMDIMGGDLFGGIVRATTEGIKTNI